MSIISKFLASKWVTVVLILALASGTYYVYRQGQLIGSSTAKVEEQEATIELQALQLETLNEQLQKKQQVNTQLAEQMAVIKRSFGAARQRIADAESNANQALRECMDMHIADGMRFGPSEDSDGDG